MRFDLSGVVDGVAVKRLVAVEASPSRSNQHEFNGVQALKEIFGTERRTFEATFVYLASNDDDPIRGSGFVTWYDAREDHPTRSEYRLYFPTTAASERLLPGDLAFILRLRSGRVLVVFTADGGTAQRQLTWLLDLPSPNQGVSVRAEVGDGERIGVGGRQILDELGLEAPPTGSAADDLGLLLNRFGETFPPTVEFSAFARLLAPAPNLEDPDSTVSAWLEREEELFRALERHIVKDGLKRGFDEDVDAFVQFSLTVQNRRKSRVGRALENHLEELFRSLRLQHSRGQVTEGTSRPDFLFPGVVPYRDTDFPADLLTMLGVKSTCKDRWRQILPEADRIPIKHLFTLEPAISSTQTTEMRSRGVVLVLPLSIHDTFSPTQRKDLLSVKEFVSLVQDRQSELSMFPQKP